MIDIDVLNDQFGIEGEVGFSELEGDLVFLSVWNKYAEVDICLYGGHVTNYQPYENFDVIYMSPLSEYEEGKAIRGGIPICFPWFGPHKTDATKPMHGFARLLYWDVVETNSLKTGETIVRLNLIVSDATRALWPYEFEAELTFFIGKKLEVSLKITNTGNEPFTYSSALHSYFNVSSIENIQIEGLKDASYYNGFENTINTQTDDLLTITEETNRRYVGTSETCLINDPVLKRDIQVEKSGSKVTVVWNPWKETTAKMIDLVDDAYFSFVCVETANAYDDEIKLAPGNSHTTQTMIMVVK